MKKPENLAGNLTEKIMAEIEPFVNDYNKTYSKVYNMVKPHTDANEKCSQELNNYDKDGTFYGSGFNSALSLLRKCFE